MEFRNAAILTVSKRAEPNEDEALTQHKEDLSMGRYLTRAEMEAEVQKRGQADGLEYLMKNLVKLATAELKAAAKAAPPADTRPLGIGAHHALELAAENERARNPKLTKAQAYTQAGETPTGRRMREIMVEQIRRGEPTVPAEVVKAAPRPTFDEETVKQFQEDVALLAKPGMTPLDREPVLRRMRDRAERARK